MAETSEGPVSTAAPAENAAPAAAQTLGYPANVNQTPVSDEQFTRLDTHADGLLAEAKAIRIIITEEELKTLPRVGPQNLAFARNVLEHFKNHPEMSVGLVNAAQLEADLREIERLTPIYHKIREAEQVIHDRIRIACGGLYQGSLVAYRGNHLRAEMGDPVAKEIDDELKPRFHHVHKSKTKTHDEETQTT